MTDGRIDDRLVGRMGDGEKRGCFHCVSEVESTGFRVLLSND